MVDTRIAFIDLKAQRDRILDRVNTGIARVLDHGSYIMGPEVEMFEAQLSEYCGAKHSMGCANGTDALSLVLMAENVGPGDAVFVPAFTFIATAEGIPLVGATPIFVDVCEDTFNMDPISLETAIKSAKALVRTPEQ